EADRGRLLHVFENLFRNSVEHGGNDVTIRVGDLPDIHEETDEEDDDQRYGFFIEDDGPGIPEEERDDVLEHGYTTSSSGTGFGLSIVRSIVEAHGWEIDVSESEEGGARFEITGVEKS
ncbi:MAG: ATP-binding protein, partial [Halobacteria archaeon]|nr:ATP-binding protein [Halobacteria archaeon]